MQVPIGSTSTFTVGEHVWYTDPSLEVNSHTKRVNMDLDLSNYTKLPTGTFDTNLDKIVDKLEAAISLSEVENLDLL